MCSYRLRLGFFHIFPQSPQNKWSDINLNQATSTSIEIISYSLFTNMRSFDATDSQLLSALFFCKQINKSEKTIKYNSTCFRLTHALYTPSPSQPLDNIWCTGQKMNPPPFYHPVTSSQNPVHLHLRITDQVSHPLRDKQEFGSHR